MGRRALPRLNPQITLDAALLGKDDLQESFDPVATFGRRAPLEVEIGSGKGLFLQTAAAAWPDHDFLGIEIVGKYARFTANRLVRDGRTNARIVHGDGIPWLRTFADGSVHALHVYFPDPWWKKRHRKRRVMNRAFFQAADRVLVPGGKLHFWTDVKEYFESTLELMRTESRLMGPFAVASQEALHDMDYRTHFERRVRRNGLPVYRAEFLREPWHTQIVVGPDAPMRFARPAANRDDGTVPQMDGVVD